MQTFKQALIALVVSGEIDQETAANAATNKHDFLVSLEHALKHKDASEREAVEAAEEETATTDEPELRVVRPAERHETSSALARRPRRGARWTAAAAGALWPGLHSRPVRAERSRPLRERRDTQLLRRPGPASLVPHPPGIGRPAVSRPPRPLAERGRDVRHPVAGAGGDQQGRVQLRTQHGARARQAPSAGCSSCRRPGSAGAWMRTETASQIHGILQDAIFSAARYLAAAGGRTDLSRGIFAYNHAQWYVDEILALARLIRAERRRHPLHLRPAPGQPPGRRADARAAEPRRSSRRPSPSGASPAGSELMYARAEAASAALRPARAREARLPGGREARRGGGSRSPSAKQKLKDAEKSSRPRPGRARGRAPSASGSSTLLASPLYQGDYVFPVGGGPSVVSVGHRHHDYPAADIAAPQGAPLYALDRRLHRRRLAPPLRELRYRPDDPRGSRRPRVDVLPSLLPRDRRSRPDRRLGGPARRPRRLDGALDRAAPAPPAFNRRAPIRRRSPGSSLRRQSVSAGRTRRRWLRRLSSRSSTASAAAPSDDPE